MVTSLLVELLVVIRVELVELLVIIVGEKSLVRLVVDSAVWPIIWTISDIWWIWLVIMVGVLLVVILVGKFGEEL